MVAIAIVGNASVSSLSSSTIEVSKIDCEKVAYSANWGFDNTLEVMRHCTGADKEVTLRKITSVQEEDIKQALRKGSKLVSYPER